MICVRHCDITTARVGVARVHRHNRPPPGGIVAWEVVVDGWPRAWAILGRPVSRALDARGWWELTRVASDGTPNACSALYGAAARYARREGRPILTYTLETEPGTSLRAAGWVQRGRVVGRQWSRASRPRRPGTVDGITKIRWTPPWVEEEP